MEKLRERHGFEKVDRALRFTCIRLGSRPETAPLAEALTEHRKAIGAARETFLQTREERVAASAEIAYLDEVVDGVIMDISRQLAVMTGNDANDPRYVALFPVAPSKGVKPIAGDAQHRFVENILHRIENEGAYDALRNNTEPLKAAQADLVNAVTRRDELYTPEMRAATDLRIALDQARRTYNKLSARLSLLFDRQALVDSFFLALRREKTETEPEEESSE